MSRSHRMAAVLGGLAGLALLAVTLPATWFAAQLNEACAGRCRLAEPDGLWWLGAARLYVAAPGAAGWIDLGPVTWSLALIPAPVVSGRLGEGRYDVRWTGAGAEATLREIALPAELLLSQPALGLPRARWGGTVQAEQVRITVTRGHGLRAAGVLRWRRAWSSALGNHPLGEYRMEGSTEDGAISLKVSGEPGNLLDAQLALARSGTGPLTVTGTLNTRDDSGLGSALRAFAQSDGAPGRYRIDLR